MSSSDAQPPLSRREARERERAAAAGGQPVTPPPTVAAPADQPEAHRRPGSHVAPAPAAPAQAAAPTPETSAAPASAAAPTSAAAASSGVPSAPPASATEIVPGSGGLTRRQIRQMRAAQGQAVQPVPLQNPTPASSDRTVQDVLGSVDALQAEPQSARPTSAPSEPGTETVALDEAAVAQATEADGSPDAIEPLETAVAHSEEPRRHRSTWAPHDAVDTPDADDAADESAPVADAEQPVAAPLPTPTTAVSSSTPVVFPLSLDEDDTNEVPIQAPTSAARPTSAAPASAPTSASRPSSAADRPTSAAGAGTETAPEAPRVPASFQRPSEPKPLTTAFEPPVGHWSQQAHGSNDTEVHDEETGARRVAVTNTNAIILPNSALADPTGALNATGEVILTGSIDLPASLSSTGSHRPIDGAEVDRLLEQHDEQPDTDASPVRASRAVSSHTSTRQVVLAAAKPKESRTPLILGVTVGAVGVAAAAVIIVALVTTHAFGG
ncbi:hypothetical protein SAMN02800687_1751 [Curtobacterium sp. UNCCL20]|uniref:hypothetical protein n=1 Tax=Curtobacterium sp. UNCCL20 TaxID=1502773 RepID=UPI0008843C2F|nr:hypothetical protein [Curtobacterium sp. UNCCL20]SDQ40529.1 hypothetical protein SAMN02800687_1751 [Curtobacterium sp. UNCCL20]